MLNLHYTLLLLSMGVFSHMAESGMPRDTIVDLATVLTRVNVLESVQHSSMSALQTTMDNLAATKTELQTIRDDLAATKTELQTTKTRLQDQEGHSSSMNRTLNSTMAQLMEQEQHSSSMNSSLIVIQQQQHHCSSSLNALKTELVSKTKNVAFGVYLTHEVHYAAYSPVKFGAVQYNAGNGYKTSTGKFTAPVSGTYIFSTELVLVGKILQSTYIRILHSRAIVSSGWGHLTQDNHAITIPVTAIIHVRAGEQVWVDSTSNVTLYSTYSSSHFVGALLSPD